MINIYINELGRIHDAEIAVKPMMVFTGDSGLGKSYTAFLIDHVYNILSRYRIGFFVQEKIQTLGEKIDKGFSFKFKDLRLWANNDAPQYLGYLTGNVDFSCSVNYTFDISDDLSINLTSSLGEDFRQIIVNGISYFYPKDYDDWVVLYGLSLNKFLTSIVFPQETLYHYMMPPARAAFMGAKNAKSAFSGIGMYEQFISFNDYVTSVSQRKNQNDQFFKSMIRRLTNGEIIVTNGQTYLRLPSGKEIPISAAASSVKELTPLLLLLQKEIKYQNLSILFEEPEAHVHPKNQDLVADLIARCFNRGMMFQITTHSDFILGRFNQLIRLGNLRRKNPEKFKKFCQENTHNNNLYLDHEQIGAYYFEEQPDGNVAVKQQYISNGIPFTTFHEIIDRQERIDDLIEKYTED
jgi:hypothetical protein